MRWGRTSSRIPVVRPRALARLPGGRQWSSIAHVEAVLCEDFCSTEVEPRVEPVGEVQSEYSLNLLRDVTGTHSWMMDSKRTTANSRDAMAAPAIKHRMMVRKKADVVADVAADTRGGSYA